MRLVDLDSPQMKDLNGFEEKFMGKTVLEWLNDMPVVYAVRVVRCGECIHGPYCTTNTTDSENWFCADGERGKDGKNREDDL